MTPHRHLGSLAAAMLVMVAVSAAPAVADWLVLQDGSRIETKGPYENRGSTVVFRLANGTLSSLRSSDVNLEASAAATAEAAREKEVPPQRPAPAPTPTPKPLIVLTDEDFPRAEPADVAANDAAAAPVPGTSEAAPQPAAPPPAGLEIVSWRPDPMAQGGTALVGEIANASSDLATDVRVTALLFDEEDKLLATSEALVGGRTLQPGQRTSFRAAFPGITEYTSVKFEPESVPLRTTGAPEN